jgi:hypothetical protein
MKNRLPFFFLFTLVFSCVASFGQSDPCVMKFSWLAGKWSTKQNGSTIVEQWSFFNGALKCMSYEVKGIDTTLIENSSISCIGGKNVFTYYPDKKNKDGKMEPVHFVLISEEHNTFIFENKEHDFPQRVVYQRVNENECHAWIEGMQKDKLEKIDFNYKRVPLSAGDNSK